MIPFVKINLNMIRGFKTKYCITHKREWRSPGTLSSREMETQRSQDPEDDGKRHNTQGGRQDSRDTEGIARRISKGYQGPGHRPRAAKGGQTTQDTTSDSGTRRRAQSKRGRLVGGGCGQCTGGRHSVPGKEVGSGCK